MASVGPTVHAWRSDVFDAIVADPDFAHVEGEPARVVLDPRRATNTIKTRRSSVTWLTTPLEPLVDDQPDLEPLDKPRGPVQVLKRRPSNRDSQRRRDALLVGKEGSRQRRRWENDRLMHVPNAQPPLPSDWEVHPTHKVHYNLPYHLAQFWDCGMREMINERRAAEAVLRRQQLIALQSHTPVPGSSTKTKSSSSKKKSGASNNKAKAKAKKPASQASSSSSSSSLPSSRSPTFGMVTRDLRVAVKKSETIKLWVRALEQPVRQYVFAAEALRRALESDDDEEEAEKRDDIAVDDDNDDDDDDDCPSMVPSDVETASATFAISDQEDDELVFVGRRNAVQKEAQASWKHAYREVNHEPIDSGILFDSLGDGETGSFKRWIAHSLSDYYGLTSQSSNKDATNRVVYVCMREEALREGAGPILIPRPMWELFEAC